MTPDLLREKAVGRLADIIQLVGRRADRVEVALEIIVRSADQAVIALIGDSKNNAPVGIWKM